MKKHTTLFVALLFAPAPTMAQQNFPTSFIPTASAPIAVSTAGTVQLVGAVSGEAIFVTDWDVVAGGTGTFQLEYGTGTNCATGTTALTGTYPATAQFGRAGVGHLFIPAGNALCIVTTGAAASQGFVAYVQTPPALPAPVNTVLPAISGSPQVGQTLTASTGTWSYSPSGFTYQWNHIVSGVPAPISGATNSTYVPVTADIGANLSVAVTATNGSGSTSATSATVGPVTSGMPAWVATVCGASFPTGGMCLDFVGNQAWDGISSSSVTLASLLSDTRSATIPYDPGTGITTTVAANTLPIGSAGLQVFQVNNLLAQSNGDYTTAAGKWATFTTVVAAPTITKNPFFGTTACTVADAAPDGSCNTTEVTFPAIAGANQQSLLQQHVVGTATATYTCYIWTKNSAATTNPQTYLSMQLDVTPYTEFARAYIQPGPVWQRFALTGTLPSGTGFGFSAGPGSVVSVGSQQSSFTPGGTMELWVSGCSPGDAPAPYVATTTATSPTIALDNIVATGDLATALGASAGAVSITTQMGGNGVAGTMLDDNGTVFLGQNAAGNTTTALGAVLSSLTVGTFGGVSYLEWSGSAGSINLNGAAANTDAASRSPDAGPFHIGTTSGTGASLNAYITAMAAYPTATAPVVASSVPITSISFGTIATLSSGTLQGTAPSTFVNGGTWQPTAADASGNIWTLCNDCGWGSFTGTAGGDVVLSEVTWSGGNHGFFNLGNVSGGGSGTPGLINSFNTPLGTFNTKQSGTQNTWKSMGLVAITDGTNIDLFGGLDWDAYGTSGTNWIQPHVAGGSIVSVVNPTPQASTTANWTGMPPFSGGILPASPATFPGTTFGAPNFIQYPSTYCGTGPDGSSSFLYSVSNDIAYNSGSNAFLARVPCSTILTSLGGSPAAASVGSNWKYYDTAHAGCTGTGTDPNCWDATLANATSIFTLTNRVGAVSMAYLPVNNRYLLSSWYNPLINGRTASTIAQSTAVAMTNFVFVDCDKPWHCSSTELPELNWSKANTGYYNQAMIMPSLSTDNGLTASMIFAGNFTANFTFTSAAVYTPNLGQIVVHY